MRSNRLWLYIRFTEICIKVADYCNRNALTYDKCSVSDYDSWRIEESFKPFRSHKHSVPLVSREREILTTVTPNEKKSGGKIYGGAFLSISPLVLFDYRFFFRGTTLCLSYLHFECCQFLPCVEREINLEIMLKLKATVCNKSEKKHFFLCCKQVPKQTVNDADTSNDTKNGLTLSLCMNVAQLFGCLSRTIFIPCSVECRRFVAYLSNWIAKFGCHFVHLACVSFVKCRSQFHGNFKHRIVHF